MPDHNLDVEVKVPSWLAAWQVLHDSMPAAWQVRLIYPQVVPIWIRLRGQSEWTLRLARVTHTPLSAGDDA